MRNLSLDQYSSSIFDIVHAFNPSYKIVGVLHPWNSFIIARGQAMGVLLGIIKMGGCHPSGEMPLTLLSFDISKMTLRLTGRSQFTVFEYCNTDGGL